MNFDPNILIPSLFGFIVGAGTLLFQIVKYRNENIKLKKAKKESDAKLSVFDKVMDLTSINNIKTSVDKIFDHTIADRFLILIAINGKEDFNYVSVIFEQHKNKELAINATARYKNIEIDAAYKQMLKSAEISPYKTVDIDVEMMDECLLKSFYELEGVNFSKVRHLLRKPLDKDNDVLIYSSFATHKDRQFNRGEKAFIKAQVEGSITPNLEHVLKH